ncbi:MAG: sulfatase/phosphatase domain-containing protein, partial [Planctomycetota bacterium]
LIMFASDNGASAAQIIRGDGHDKSAAFGSAKSYLCLGPGFSTAANTPFRLHKHWNHEGGISSPFIAHWPEGIEARGELRHDPSHFIDIAPTILELAGADSKDVTTGPKRPGRSLLPAFAKNRALGKRTLWWSHSGNRAIRVGDWKLSAKGGAKAEWELYDLKTDRCEMNNLASEYPRRVLELSKRWKEIGDGFRKDLAAEKGA